MLEHIGDITEFVVAITGLVTVIVSMIKLINRK